MSTNISIYITTICLVVCTIVIMVIVRAIAQILANRSLITFIGRENLDSSALVIIMIPFRTLRGVYHLERFGIPNWLTAFRLASGFIITAILTLNLYSDGSQLVAFCVFIVAAVTDFVDGFFARHRDREGRDSCTAFGRGLDPIADKCLQYPAVLYLIITLVKAETNLGALLHVRGVSVLAGIAAVICLLREISLLVSKISAYIKWGKWITVKPHNWSRVRSATLTVLTALIAAYLLIIPWIEAHSPTIQAAWELIAILLFFAAVALATASSLVSGWIECRRTLKEGRAQFESLRFK